MNQPDLGPFILNLFIFWLFEKIRIKRIAEFYEVPYESENSQYCDLSEVISDRGIWIQNKSVLEQVRAEESYFTTIDGCKGSFKVANMTVVAQMPQIAEQFFLWLNAQVVFMPVSTSQDLSKATYIIESVARKYAIF